MTRRLLSEAEGYELLKAAGVPVPAFSIAATAEAAAQAAEVIGYPVVLKVISPGVIHKSDAGGVITGIRSADEARDAFLAIHRNIAAAYPAAAVSGIMVEQQLSPGLELIIGGKTDPTFGKVLTVGMGGRLVEFLHDISLRILPVDKSVIQAMIRELKGYQLIRGYRGDPEKDLIFLTDTISAVARMFFEDDRIEEFDINPLVLYEKGGCAVDARFYVIEPVPESRTGEVVPALPDSLLKINSIALVGASADPGKVGYAICRNLLTFSGALYPVNPKATRILGRQAYPSLAAIPGTVDVAVISIPAAGVPQVIEDAGKKKIPLVIVISSGFREGGAAGKELEARVLATARKYGIRLMGPNCLGLMLPHQGINTTFDPVSPKPGKIAFISQSGALITTIVDWSLPEEIGFSSVISLGNQADLSFEDFIRFAANDPDTKAIILYIEQVRYGKRFMDAVSSISSVKPVVVIKSGSSVMGQKAAASHTGSLAGSYDVYMAAFRQAGAIPVNSIREAFQAAELLASEGYPRGNRAIVITNAGGFAVLSSDYAERYGIGIVEFPGDLIRDLDAILPPNWSRENPIDMVGDSGADKFAKTFDLMIRNQDLWDIAFVVAIPSAVSDPVRIANELVRFSKHTDKMIVGCMIGGDSMKTPVRILHDAQIPNFPDLEDAFKAVGNVCRHKCSSYLQECRHGE